MLEACVPMPLQVVLDDVGWWCGRDGPRDDAHQEPFRTGIARDHVPADYLAVARLGRRLNMRPQAAFVACEWDKHNILRELPNSTWMGTQWDNSRRVGPWIDEAAQLLRDHRDHVEVTLHGVGHEFWIDGRMSRAEWHDADGRMRPHDDVRRHLDTFQRILDQHDLGPMPESFVPCAFLHRFGAGSGGLAAILRDVGVRYLSTPFSTMHSDRAPDCKWFGVDEGLVTVTRDAGTFSIPWYAIDAAPSGEIAGPICGLHWPNILHHDPARNDETVNRWVEFLQTYGRRFDRVLSRNTRDCWTQLVHHVLTRIDRRGGSVELDFAAVDALPARHLADELTVKVRAAQPIALEARGVAIVEQRRDVILLAEMLGEGDVFLVERVPPVHDQGVTLGGPQFPGKDRPACENDPSRRHRGQTLCEGFFVDDTFRRQPVQIGCLDPLVAVGADIVPPERVADDHENVHSMPPSV